MKKYINILASAAVAVLALSCVKEEAKVAKAVLGDVSIMNFTATNPEPQSLTVVSDGPWHTTAPAWITVTPETGDGETVVTVTAAENTDAEGLLEPRKDTVYLSGNKLSSRHMIIVSQAGDAYRSAEHLTVAQIAALSDGKSFVLDEATVVAVTKAGYVITDGTVNVYVKASSEVALGDKVSLKGIKGTVNGVPVVATVDGCSVKESGTAEYPEPIDLNAQIATYAATSMEYVKASGLVSGGMLIVTVDETEYAIKQVDATDAADLAALNGHKATVTGYSYGILGAKMFAVLATDVKDDGLDQVIYFEDNFEWMETWTSVAEAGDDIKNNVVDTDHAPNVFGNAEAFADFISAFQTKGYGYVWGWKGQDWSNGSPDNGNKRTLYLQRNYLKFGKSKYSSGIILPALSSIEGTDDILLSFDWCSCMTGTGLPDLTTLAVVVADGGTFEENGTTTSDEIKSAQPIDDAGKTKLEWQHVEIRINGATSATRITIRPFNADPDVTNSARHQNRWYLDNVKVVPADGGSAGGKMSPGITVFEDDLEWLDAYSKATDAPDDVTDNKVNTTKNIFTTDALKPILSDLQTKGYGYIWGGKGKTEWSTATPEGDACTLYLLKNYLKFGKTDWNSGLVLPALGAVKGSADVELTFDWCWCMTGKSKPDIMTLTVEVEDGEKFELTSAQPTADDLTKLEWQHASVAINDVTSLTRIILRPTNVDPNVSSTRGQNRWYLDNIKIVTK